MRSLLFISFFLLSCGVGNKYMYLYSLKNNDDDTNTFKDDNVNIDFIFTDKMINFTLKNKTDIPLKIEWDESSIVLNGMTEKIIHQGVKLIDAERSQSPTMVPPRAMISDAVMPSSKIIYRDRVKDRNTNLNLVNGGWIQGELYPTIDLRDKERRAMILGNKGKTLGLFLAIYINKELKNYYFEFDITDVVRAK